MGFLGTISFILVVLKILGIFTMSWWIVLAPLWIGWLAFGVVAITAALIGRASR